MSEPLFTSDTHFYDESIIYAFARPFKTVDAMNEALIANWNAKVKNDDLVYHLGDFALKCSAKQAKAILDQLNGRIILIRGNNDSVAELVKHRFAAMVDYAEISVDDSDAPKGNERKIALLHYAMRVWRGSHNGSWHLYGHTHGTLPDDPYSLSFDIGVDCWDFAPLTYQEVKSVMTKKLFAPGDDFGE